MKYIIDKNALSKDYIKNLYKRHDLCITEDVVEEAYLSPDDISEIKKSGVQILSMTAFHLRKLTELMSQHGDNLKLINLYSGKGTADVTMLAFILAEQEKSSLFPEEYTIITKDTELTRIANVYNIPCLPDLITSVESAI